MQTIVMIYLNGALAYTMRIFNSSHHQLFYDSLLFVVFLAFFSIFLSSETILRDEKSMHLKDEDAVFASCKRFSALAFCGSLMSRKIT